MATYSTGYQFKLISTGEDPDTWGIGTNENFEKIEAAVGRAVEVDINPATAPSSYSGTTTGVFTWVTDSASLATAAGGEGRCAYVAFTNTLTVGSSTTIKVRGATDSDLPTRTFIAKNSLGDSSVISLDMGGGSSYQLRNGHTAVVFSSPNSITNAMGLTQAEGVDFRDVPSPKILVSVGDAALSISDGTLDVLKVDTSGSKLALGGPASSVTLEVDGTDDDLALVSSGVNSSITITPDGTGNCVSAKGFTGDLAGNASGNSSGSAERITTALHTGTTALPIAGTIQAQHVPGPEPGLYGEVVGTGTGSVPGSYNVSLGRWIVGGIGDALKTENMRVNEIKGHVTQSRPLTFNEPVVEAPVVAATGWALADHDHTSVNRGGAVVQDLAPVVKTISLDSISYPLFADAFFMANANDFGWYGGVIPTIDPDTSTVYDHRVAHGVTNPKLVTACLKLESFGDETGSTAGYFWHGGWSIGDRIPILSSANVGADYGGFYDNVEIPYMPAFIDRANVYQPDNYRPKASGGSHRGYRKRKVNADSASCSWGWNDDDVYVILGARMYAGLSTRYPHQNQGSPPLAPFTIPSDSPRWFQSMAGHIPRTGFVPIVGMKSSDQTGDGTTTLTYSAADAATVSDGDWVSLGGITSTGGGTPPPLIPGLSDLNGATTVGGVSYSQYFIVRSGPGANEFTLKRVGKTDPHTGVVIWVDGADVETVGSWVSGGHSDALPREDTGGGPPQCGGYRVLGKFMGVENPTVAHSGPIIGTPGWSIEFTIHP
jgi:hypothetical protein